MATMARPKHDPNKGRMMINVREDVHAMLVRISRIRSAQMGSERLIPLGWFVEAWARQELSRLSKAKNGEGQP